MTSDGSKVLCCKEQYCIGTWNVRSVYQGKLEVVKQEMARVNTNILRIGELKWTGMSKFNSDDHYIYNWALFSLSLHLVIVSVVISPLFSSGPRFVRTLTTTCLSLVALHGMAHSFFELDKAMVHVISLVSLQ